MAQLIVKLKQRELTRTPLTRREVLIGRDPTNDVVIDNAGISRVHASITLEGSEFVLRDLDSANGVHIEGQQVQERVLRDGDQFQIGKFLLEFAWHGGPSVEQLAAGQALRPPPQDELPVVDPLDTTYVSPSDLARALDAAGHPGWGAFEPRQQPQNEPSPRPPTRVRPSATPMSRSLDAAIAVAIIVVVVLAFLAFSEAWL